MQFNCVKKTARKNELAQHSFPIRFVSFFVSSVCLLVSVTMVDKNKAVVCCLWDSLSELCCSLGEIRLERTALRSALFPVKTAQFIQFFRQVWRHTVKSFSLTESV